VELAATSEDGHMQCAPTGMNVGSRRQKPQLIKTGLKKAMFQFENN
jgi:hypothetical protein